MTLRLDDEQAVVSGGRSVFSPVLSEVSKPGSPVRLTSENQIQSATLW